MCLTVSRLIAPLEVTVVPVEPLTSFDTTIWGKDQARANENVFTVVKERGAKLSDV